MSIIARRNWALRLSIVLNVCVLLYVCAHLTSSGPWIEEAPSNWGASNAVSLGETYGSQVDSAQQVNASQRTRLTAATQLKPRATKETSQRHSEESGAGGPDKQRQRQNQQIDNPTASGGAKSRLTAKATLKKLPDAKNQNSPLSASGRKDDPGNKTVRRGHHGEHSEIPETLDFPDPIHFPPDVLIERKGATQPIMTLEEAIQCHEKSTEPRRAQRGDYWVLYNYVPMSIAVKCWESVTYTTHADYTFLDNLEPLLERWRAPLSIAMHAPGTDFQPTLDSIKYARSCGSPLIAQLVTFHIYFSSKHIPKSVPQSEKVVSESYNCSLGPPWANVVAAKMYKNEKKLLYPVNVGRNVARESAPTYYVLASDIELYPSPNLPSAFLNMIARRDQSALFKPNPKVFVLSIFEVDEKSKPPLNKTSLMQMLKAGSAIPFHKKLCAGCHNVPKSKEWQEAAESELLHVFHVGKRTGKFIHWEPIFIGTNLDPLYEERLSWEGKSDKMTQGYALCVLDYDFLILDNAFLVHRPGIKIFKKDSRRDTLTAKTNMLIRKIIVPELKVMYGTRKGCAV